MEIKINKEKAKKLYDYQPDWFKEELEKEFKAETFKKVNFRDLNSFDDCCKACDTSEEEFNKKYLSLPISADALGLERLGIINQAINEDGWEPDYGDANQQKWFPYFEKSSSGLGFRGSDYRYGHANTCVGSRLCLKDQERSNFSGTRFLKYWEAFITNKELKNE
jgi:hypothetical protein